MASAIFRAVRDLQSGNMKKTEASILQIDFRIFETMIIGVAGGSGSGLKNNCCRWLSDHFGSEEHITTL